MIAFLHPWMLAGLLAAGIPIVLHLLARREPPTVLFPAVRYLRNATREHQRRLKLQNWLLLLLRTLLIVALVLAAAGPTVPVSGVPGHAPSALVLVVDNSPSSAAVAGGTPRLEELQATARAVLARATPDDALWLVTADGVPRRGDAASLRAAVDSLQVSPRRLDLGQALALGAEVLAPEPRPGEIVLVSDLQASAVSAAEPDVPVVVARPAGSAIANVGIGTLTTSPQPWSGDGGRVAVALVGDSGAAARPVSVRLGDRPGREALATVGSALSLALPGVPGGWWTLAAELEPDELRLDDRRVASVRVAPLARIAWDPADRHLAAAAEVLESNRRIARGDEITLGRLGRGPSIVQPPADPAALGALNRALAQRGVGWSFGAPVAAAEMTDSGPLIGRERVLRRHRLQPSGSGRTGVLATVGGAPWIVRSDDVVLIGSRLDPEWTALPLSAGFMPFMDVLLNRVARGEVVLVEGVPGDPVTLPDRVTEVRLSERVWPAEGGGLFRPPETGVYFLLEGRDTVGALSVNPDPRESRLARAEDAQLRRLWPGVRIADLDEGGALAFSSAARGDLRGPLLWTALLLGMMEVGMASLWRRRS